MNNYLVIFLLSFLFPFIFGIGYALHRGETKFFVIFTYGLNAGLLGLSIPLVIIQFSGCIK